MQCISRTFALNTLLGVSHGHADGVEEGGVLGVEAFCFVLFAVDYGVDVFLLAFAALQDVSDVAAA